MRVPSSVAVLAASLAQSQAQYLLNDLSFGFGTRISPEGQSTIPNFSIQGVPNLPELLSNKLILTPPAPGNQRGAVWSDRQLTQSAWIADVEFRASGPDRGGGNLQIWLVRDGAHDVGSSSIYTVSKFEGLALVIDTHGGSGGMIRGFLNDGSTDYKNAHSVDSLSFGNCHFAYRNLGRPSQVKLRHSPRNFRVEIDGELCFESEKVRIPDGYHIGLTAASADNPDSFEVFKLVVLSEQGRQKDQYDSHSDHYGQQQAQAAHEPEQHVIHERSGTRAGVKPGAAPDDPYDSAIPDVKADTIHGTAAQFADLHDRIQSINHHLSTIFSAIANAQTVGENRHEETSVMLGDLKNLMSRLDKLDKLEQMERKMVDIENSARSFRNEMGQKFKEQEHILKSWVVERGEDLHYKIHESAKEIAPTHTKLILVVVGSQVLLVLGYVLYKRRKSSPKKYL